MYSIRGTEGVVHLKPVAELEGPEGLAQALIQAKFQKSIIVTISKP